jgi:hypothetical protein
MDSLLNWHFSSMASNRLSLAPKVDQQIPMYSLYLFPSNYNKGFNHVHLHSPSLDTCFIFHARISTSAWKYLQHVRLIEETMMTHLPCTPHALNPLESSSYTNNSPPYSMYFISIFAKAVLIRFWMTRVCYEHLKNKTHWNGPNLGKWVHDGMINDVRPGPTIHNRSSIFASTGWRYFCAPVQIWAWNIKDVWREGEYKWTWLKPLL